MIILIYYRDAAGKICDYMVPPAGWTLGQVKQEIESFNILHGGGFRAYMEFVREDSFAAYLLERAGA